MVVLDRQAINEYQDKTILACKVAFGLGKDSELMSVVAMRSPDDARIRKRTTRIGSCHGRILEYSILVLTPNELFRYGAGPASTWC